MQAQGVLFGQIAAVFGIVIAGVWGATQWTAACWPWWSPSPCRCGARARHAR